MSAATGPAPAAATSAPASAVLAEFWAGTTSLADIAGRTGLAPDLVRAVVDRLVATGRLRAERLTTGCPEDACGGCGLARAGAPCAAGPAGSPGPVLLRLAR